MSNEFGFRIENADLNSPYDYRPPNHRQVAQDRSGTYWNLLAPLMGGPTYPEPPEIPRLGMLRRIAAHFDRLNAASRSRAAAMPAPVPTVAASEPPRPMPAEMPPVERSPREAAKAFLRFHLGEGGQLAQKVIEGMASQAGIAGKTLRRAKEDLNVKAVKTRHGWYWKM